MFKISIVTVVYNAANDLEVTINSVLKQTYKEIEYIVIDGASTDGTLDVLNSCA
ncbi:MULTISPECIES: glycosyltransferase [unclassified Klebsiella]|uniref:glycosyltransferase n=1 Tax=unclassified Klebsiella TaxID=2608929 RepID=UPI0016038207|nr:MULTISPECIES: glycosyltransferase [unclassified Klebsiella]